MDKIDYSVYRLKYSSHSNKNKSDKVVLNIEPEKKEIKRNGGVAILTVLLLLSFAVTFVVAELLGGGALSAALGATSDTAYFYAVVAECETLESARDMAVLARAGGGGGNIVAKGKTYLVVFAAYPDKESAETVSARSDTVKTERFSTTPLSVAGAAEYCKKFNDLKRAAADEVYALILEFARGAERSVIAPALDAAAETFNDLKAAVNADTQLSANQKLEIIVAIDTVCGRLTSVGYVANDGDILSNLRYQHFAVLAG